MKSHVRVVVIGGGVVGCSVLFHLASLGWRDAMLLERRELTAGSSWHAAGGFHSMNADPNMARLQSYTIGLYPIIQRLSGTCVGMHVTGGLSVAATADRWDFLRAQWARRRVLGLESHLLGPTEVRDLCPIMETQDIVGALLDPQEGYLDPSGTTHAYAKAAMSLGAQVHRHTRVIKIMDTRRGTWRILTNSGEVEAEHVVNAAGLWAREVGQMLGVTLPLIPMEHHYLITGDIPVLANSPREMPAVVDLDGEIYLRQERHGVLLGVYEQDATPWAVNGTPWEYGATELLPPKLDRLTDTLSKGFERFPAVAAAGIRRVVNGPCTFTPDGNPLVGPVPGASNCWLACGVMAGFAQGGGVGLALAQWMVNGEPDLDISAMDITRFGDYASKSYVLEKAREFYARRTQLAYPNEYWPAARPAKTSPLYDHLTSLGAVHSVSDGLEVPLYFAPSVEAAHELLTFRRSNAFESVAAECQAARQRVAVWDGASLAQLEICGPDARAWLDNLVASRLPEVGEVRFVVMLSESGRLAGVFNVHRPSRDRFVLVGAGAQQRAHMRWLADHNPPEGVTVRNLSDQYTCLALIGPRSRELLQKLTAQDVSTTALPPSSCRMVDVSNAPALVSRVSMTGDLAYEVYVPARFAAGLVRQIEARGAQLGLRHLGLYALNSLRLEKGHGAWSRDYTRDCFPNMSGLSRCVDYEKPGFVGRDRALLDRGSRPKRSLVTLSIEGADSDAAGFEPIWRGADMVGYVTSGGYGHTLGKSLALGYLDTELIGGGETLEVSIIGERHRAYLLETSPFDPQGSALNS